MKPVTHPFHSDPPHHGARYYLAFAGAILVVAVAYACIELV
ncbi:hypothetical protein [Cupriavidus pinatubonensis]|nr:hypothetical protein [Cupriavidus pinatubonensis]